MSPFRHERASARERTPLAFAVRQAVSSDAAALEPLFGQLGHPASAAELEGRLASRRDDSCLLVASADEDGRLLGMCAGRVFRPWDADAPCAQLEFLITDRGAKGQGVGTALAASFDAWALQRGAVHGVAVEGGHGPGHHRSYESFGYAPYGTAFVKRLR